MTIDYSIVVPVYGGEATLDVLFDRTKSFFEGFGKTFQMIFVDDESADSSWQKIVALKQAHPKQIKAIKLSKNFGQQKATLCGINHSSGNIIITIDEDLQVPPEEIKKLIDKYNETHADLIYGLFEKSQQTMVRKAGSWFVNKFFSAFASTTGSGSSFRLITRKLADKLVEVNQAHLLLDEVLNWYTSNIAYEHVDHLEREDGKSGYSIYKLMLMTFGYVVYYTVIPLRIMTYVGFFFSLISFVIGVFYIYTRLMREVELGFTSIIVAIFFSTSIILFSLGIIGEYISRFYQSAWGKPPYMIEEII